MNQIVIPKVHDDLIRRSIRIKPDEEIPLRIQNRYRQLKELCDRISYPVKTDAVIDMCFEYLLLPETLREKWAVSKANQRAKAKGKEVVEEDLSKQKVFIKIDGKEEIEGLLILDVAAKAAESVVCEIDGKQVEVLDKNVRFPD